MENLNAEQIIKELEGLVKFSTCPEYVQKAFALIIELTAENERLREQNERYAELEEGCYVTGYKNIKADTVKKMQERLKVHCADNRYWCELIDQIAKEILEGT